MVYPLRRQPLRSLYLLYEAITSPFRISSYYLLLLFRFNRPRKSWTLKKAVMVRMIQRMSILMARCGPTMLMREHTHHKLSEGPGIKGVWVAPTPHLIVGDVKKWAEVASIDMDVRLPGYWVDKSGKDVPLGERPQPGEKVLYALHGGGFEQLSAHPASLTTAILDGILSHVTSFHRAFSIEYRLSTGPPEVSSNPFPAALIDALAGYHYLVNAIGFAPEDIVVTGDSAGGNLAVALVRYLIENSTLEGLPGVPARLILNSPWGDITTSDVKEGCSAHTNVHVDYLDVLLPRMQLVRNNYCGPLGYEAAYTNRYISPASESPRMEKVSFKGFPKTFISGGGSETLIDQIRRLKDMMVADMGEDMVEYCEPPDAVHDYLVFPWHEPERSETLEQISTWMASE